MNKKLCIHGHFYQPPREDPSLGRILIEPSAAPMRHWNSRITRESYAPLGWARRLDSQGRIADILNCYEWMSFNVGPTLMHWLKRQEPALAARIQEADRNSLARWGYGNAIAQVYHHIILPLASPLDKELEITWALADFRANFNREAEGIWLAECAADVASLEAVAAHGLRFVVLAPRQAAAVEDEEGRFVPVHADNFDLSLPYLADLPSGANLAIFFYNAGLSQAVAFEGLLSDGEYFWQRMARSAATDIKPGGLLTLSTDGETYGHHFKFGEMSLAHALSQGYAGRDSLELTNFSAFLAANPPRRKVRLHEPSSWSCAHGVERWRSDCGCRDGGHPGWNQRWRAPLREALDNLKTSLDAHFLAAGSACFKKPRQALLDYGAVLANAAAAESFRAKNFKDNAIPETAWQLLAMQESALAAFASCAWFFDDISRLEPVNAMTFALRAMDLAGETGLAGLRTSFEAALEKAESNKPEEGNGRRIFSARALPRHLDAASLCLLGLTQLAAEGRLPLDGRCATLSWPGLAIEAQTDASGPDAAGYLTGRAELRLKLAPAGLDLAWRWLPPGQSDNPDASAAFTSLARSEVTVTMPDGSARIRKLTDLPRNFRDFLSLTLLRANAEQNLPKRLGLARHLLSVWEPWEEGQTNQPGPELWINLAPELALLCVTEGAPPQDKLDQLRSLFDNNQLSREHKRTCQRLVASAFTNELQKPDYSAETLATWAKRANRLFPDMDWWDVQNAFWAEYSQKPDLKPLANLLGFRIG